MRLGIDFILVIRYPHPGLHEQIELIGSIAARDIDQWNNSSVAVRKEVLEEADISVGVRVMELVSASECTLGEVVERALGFSEFLRPFDVNVLRHRCYPFLRVSEQSMWG
jgi:hypothetical protein